MSELLQMSSRVALSAFLHDMGKFAERARVADGGRIDALKTLYCPKNFETDRHTHIHAAYTALAFDLIEQQLPDLICGDMSPFDSSPLRDANGKLNEKLDNIANACAYHHKPSTFLQWIIATADRVASGFERESFEKYNQGEEKTETGKNHYQARQLTLFEQVFNEKFKSANDLKYCYPLKPMSAQAIFPQLKSAVEPADNDSAQKEYTQLWQQFTDALKEIPASHRKSLPLWLDHFDSAWLTFTHAIPAATAFGSRPDVSLYDHSKTTAALAVALWRYHHDTQTENDSTRDMLKERKDFDDDKLLFIQGDFFGIQEFIFSQGAQTNKNASKILRGRSFQVSLFTELAALKVLEALDLPTTNQIINAAGKFTIVAPNTQQTIEKLTLVQAELNQWFITHTFGVAGMGLAWLPASCNNLLSHAAADTSDFSWLMRKLFEQQERSKFQRMNLCSATAKQTVFDVSYPEGVCAWNERLPADGTYDDKPCASLTSDQITIGQAIVKKDRLLVFNTGADVRDNDSLLETDIFGYRVLFTDSEQSTGKFSELAKSGILRRCWDYSSPVLMDETLFKGYARRAINGYVPLFNDILDEAHRYSAVDSELSKEMQNGNVKTLSHLACEDRRLTEHDKWVGQVALTTLKGDVDNLGHIFQTGLKTHENRLSMAKLASLSRQMNSFFALYLPALCATEFKQMYTVFAGGDDFFMIGPWHSTQQFAHRMHTAFNEYVAHNPQIHFSAGMSTTKAGIPINTMAELAEDALSESKKYPADQEIKQKNAVTVFNQTIAWQDWEQIQAAQGEIKRLSDDYQLSTGYVYSLLSLIELKGKGTLESAMWRSRFVYKTQRMLEANKNATDIKRALNEIANSIGEKGIEQLGNRYKIALFNHFYLKRERGGK